MAEYGGRACLAIFLFNISQIAPGFLAFVTAEQMASDEAKLTGNAEEIVVALLRFFIIKYVWSRYDSGPGRRAGYFGSLPAAQGLRTTASIHAAVLNSNITHERITVE